MPENSQRGMDASILPSYQSRMEAPTLPLQETGMKEFIGIIAVML
jgi:hypothetical protein